MSSELVFITGATGFIGAAATQEALKSGYRVRLAVRKEENVEKLKGIFSEYADKVEFTIVPDITAPGAFANSLDGVTYILHVASPLARSPDPEVMFPPAVEGTLSILRDAAKVASVKKVVVTSSIAALYPVTGIPDGGVVKEETDWDLSVDPKQNFDAGHPFMTAMRVYGASKLLANKATFDFLKSEKPHYAIVTIHPSLVYGHSLVQKSVADGEGSTNSFIFGSIMNGQQGDAPLLSVHIDNVAEAHIKALDPKIKSGSSYLVSGKSYTWKDVTEWAQKYYPDVQFKVVPDGNPKVSKTDTTRAETELGLKWTEPEVMIKEVLDQQLAFLK